MWVLTSAFAISLEIHNSGFEGRTLDFVVGERKGRTNGNLSPGTEYPFTVIDASSGKMGNKFWSSG
jgi:hypothetical protein